MHPILKKREQIENNTFVVLCHQVSGSDFSLAAASGNNTNTLRETLTGLLETGTNAT